MQQVTQIPILSIYPDMWCPHVIVRLRIERRGGAYVRDVLLRCNVYTDRHHGWLANPIWGRLGQWEKARPSLGQGRGWS